MRMSNIATPPTILPGIPEDQRARAAQLYWEAFGPKLGRVMGPPERACGFFAATMDGDFALSALDPDGQLLGIAGFKTQHGSLTGGTMGDLTRVYGRWGGLWRALTLSLLERDLEPGVLLMDGICVAAQGRGQGIGSALLDAVINEARDRRLGAVRLDVIADNPRARALYERKGFKAGATTRRGPLRMVFGFDRATVMHRNVDPSTD